MRKAGNLGQFLRTFTSGFSRLTAACSVRLEGKGGPAKMRCILMKRGAILDINRSMGHGFVSDPFLPEPVPRYVRKDRIWFQIPVRNKKKLRISVPDPFRFVFGSPGSGSLIYLHGSGSFHQQAKSYDKPGFILLCDSLITF
jgi:hypothetical protein